MSPAANDNAGRGRRDLGAELLEELTPGAQRLARELALQIRPEVLVAALALILSQDPAR